MKTPGAENSLGGAIVQLIKRAAVDAAFKTRMLSERSEIAPDVGVKLHPSEKRLLDTYPENLLVDMIDNMRVASSERRTFLKASMLAAATISTGMVGNVVAGVADKNASPDTKGTDVKTLLEQLKKIEEQLEAVRKKLQKESDEASANLSRRQSEREEVPHQQPMIVAGIMPAPEYRQRRKTPAEEARDAQELERVKALQKILEEIESEAQAALIELKVKKKALSAK